MRDLRRVATSIGGVLRFNGGLHRVLEGGNERCQIRPSLQILQGNKMKTTKEAKSLLSAASITSSQSFESLNEAQLAVVQAEAGEAYQQKYGKPISEASPTYLRKRFDLIQRRARS